MNSGLVSLPVRNRMCPFAVDGNPEKPINSKRAPLLNHRTVTINQPKASFSLLKKPFFALNGLQLCSTFGLSPS